MIITRTPFRISFFGGGTDYPVWYKEHGGAVLSVSIDKYCYITTRYLPPFFDCKYRIRYAKQEETNTISDIKHPSVRECLAFLDFKRGIEMQHNADVPGMSGLGSSSAFTVGLLKSLYALEGKNVSKKQLAADAIEVEQKRILENVGSQDQISAAYGGFNVITFGGADHFKVEPIIMNKQRREQFEKNLMLVFTGYPRNASEIAAEQIQRTPEKQKELKRMYEMVEEAKAILVNQDKGLDDFGELLDEGWNLKRELSSKITTPHIDDIYQSARRSGSIGGKLLGAGGGGFMLLYVRPEMQRAVRESLKDFLVVPFHFDMQGSHVIYSMPDGDITRVA